MDRLFILLESGQSAVTRRAAAHQIGEVQKLHPHELHNLLNRVQLYLQNSSWETRIAAGQTIEAILKNVPKWSAPVAATDRPSNGSKQESPPPVNLLSFDLFNLELVLTEGARLMGSEGLEFDYTADDSSGQSNGAGGREEVLVRQQRLINEKLGLTQGLSIDQIVSLEDMKVEAPEVEDVKPVGVNVQEIFKQTIEAAESSNAGGAAAALPLAATGMSCREQNRARRKARQATTISSVAPNGNGNGGGVATCSGSGANGVKEEPCKKKIKLENATPPPTATIKDPTLATTTLSPPSDPVPDGTGSWSSGDNDENNGTLSWPFHTFCTHLMTDLFKPRWEIRHGAATGLRELFKSHLDGAGQRGLMTAQELTEAHLRWLEDACLRLLSVLALDRFGDFVSDQVIAPVRETCAQVLGTLLKRMPEERVQRFLTIVLVMVNHRQDWEVRHGALLVIKYLLVVREDLLHTVLPMVIAPILSGLFDEVDDVSAVAASTLIPIATWLPKLLSPGDVSNIVKTLWNLLLEQDELTSACNSFMGLLAAILGLPDAPQWIAMEPAESLVPRLWPFLCHNSSSVRRSTLVTLKTLTASCNTPNASPHFGVKDWPSQLLQQALRHIYQRILIEHLEEIQTVAEQVWLQLIGNADLSALLHAACPYVPTWLCLAMQPARLAFDPSYLISVVVGHPTGGGKKRSDLGVEEAQQQQPKFYLGGAETIPMDVRERNVMRARYKACQMIGALSRYLVLPAPGVLYTSGVESPIDCYTKVLNGHLSSRSALQRLITGLVIAFWAQADASVRPGPPVMRDRLAVILQENIYYEEVTALYARLLEESRCFVATLRQYKVPVPGELSGTGMLSLEQVNVLATWPTETLKAQFHLRVKLVEMIEERRKSLQSSYVSMTTELNTYNIYTQAALAGASICVHSLPQKLNPVVRPIMESLKREENEILQRLSADFLVYMLDQLRERSPCPNGKIVTNLSIMLKGDVEYTPRRVWPEKVPVEYGRGEDKEQATSNPVYGILTLSQQQQQQQMGQRAVNGGAPRPVGRPPNNTSNSEQTVEEGGGGGEAENSQAKLNKLHRLGAAFALTKMSEYFGAELPQKVPSFWELLHCRWIMGLTEEVVEGMMHGRGGAVWSPEATDEILTALQLIEVCVPHMSRGLDDQVFALLPQLCLLLKHPLSGVRHLTARCVATYAAVDSVRVMDVVMAQVVPSLGNIEKTVQRQGAAEAIACIVNRLQLRILPYVVLLVIPMLGRMSDIDQPVRLMATHCFATLIQLMPLDGSSLEVPQLSAELVARKEKDKQFLEHLFAPKSIPDVQIPAEVKAALRSYQRAGVNWLWFLNRYKLHGILCDDMGLGKTLQAICVLAVDQKRRREEGEPEWPNLIICPPTLTGHWFYEVQKFVADSFLTAVHYVGFPADREKLRSRLRTSNLVIASYDIVRKDIEHFQRVNWNYCVLDEGHIIKNGKTKCSKAIKLLVANHRLILSGTPIQNNVLELWSLFDFLMPGFLGTERQFVTRYSRPILASRDGKSSSREQEAGTLALESLHRQVLPFLLRRIKEDVLVDLPPKITQDLLCELSPLQEKLYEDFSKKHFKNDLQECLGTTTTKANGGGGGGAKTTHVFQALR